MSTELQDWLIYRFIQRPGAVAVQKTNGTWAPLRENPAEPDSPLIPWGRSLLQDHLDRKATYGHYLLDSDNNVKLFAFDIDFVDQGWLPGSYTEEGVPTDWRLANLRNEWHDRLSPHRSWMKYQLRAVGGKIASRIFSELGIPTAMAYSGNKGIHVYGFCDTMPAADARIAGEIVMKGLDTFTLSRGSFEWTDTNPDGYTQVTVEVFPKQDTIDNGGFGNLMALPLGVNQKWPDDPKFFVDMRAPLNEIVPADPIWALSTANPWE